MVSLSSEPISMYSPILQKTYIQSHNPNNTLLSLRKELRLCGVSWIATTLNFNIRTLRGVRGRGVGGLNGHNKDVVRPIYGSMVPYPPSPYPPRVPMTSTLQNLKSSAFTYGLCTLYGMQEIWSLDNHHRWLGQCKGGGGPNP